MKNLEAPEKHLRARLQRLAAQVAGALEAFLRKRSLAPEDAVME
jgi:hypothetical protein